MGNTKEERCKILYMENGKPQECGGKIEPADFRVPANPHNPLHGGVLGKPFLYRFCTKCHVLTSG